MTKIMDQSNCIVCSPYHTEPINYIDTDHQTLFIV